MRMTALLCALFLVGCDGPASEPAEPPDASIDMGLQWVKFAAEYRAVTRQVYSRATADLPGFIDDTSWSALPQQQNAEALPTAVILDVDETVVSNIDFQLSFEPPFENWKLEEWTASTPATPIEGVREFVEAARAQGVTVFFVTNRPCELKEGDPDPCPQRQTTIEDIAEVGIETNADHVFLSEERGWTREKITRRMFIAERYRVLMLIGDDYGDFVPCMRSSLRSPCETIATAQDRLNALDQYDDYWGHGWYILPNPMHGSWTSFSEWSDGE